MALLLALLPMHLEHPQSRLEALVTMQFGLMFLASNPISLLFSRMELLLLVAYMAQGLERKRTQEWSL